MAVADGSHPGSTDPAQRLATLCRTDEVLRARLMRHPREVLREHGVAIPAQDDARAIAAQVLAALGPESGELSEAELAALAAGFFMKFEFGD